MSVKWNSVDGGGTADAARERTYAYAMRIAILVVLACGCGRSSSPGSESAGPPEVSNIDPAPIDSAEPPVFAALDAVGTLVNRDYDPRPVIAAINELQPMGRDKGTATLAAYLEARGHSVDDRGGLFAVLRVLYVPPAVKPPWPPDACTPQQTELLSGPCLRPPMLGAPSPPAPNDLRSLRYPFFVLGDVPLSLVAGYALAGKAEPVDMHFEALSSANTGWLAAPLEPKSAGEIRYLFMHYGQWSPTDEVGKGVESQLQRME